jgi:hypothetical protein
MQDSTQATLTALRFGPAPPPAEPLLTLEEQQTTLQAAAAQAVALETQYLRGDRTMRNYDRVNSEFSRFLPHFYPSIDRGWQECRPDHILVYLFHHLLPSHPGRDGGLPASSTVIGLMSALTRCFDRRGRIGVWTPTTSHCNPVRALDVQSALQAYQRLLIQSGVRERSAVPMRALKLRNILRAMLSEAADLGRKVPKDIPAITLRLRDSAMLTYMWGSSRRGADMLYAGWAQVYLQGSDLSLTPVSQVWGGPGVFHHPDTPAGGSLLIVPSQSKTEHVHRPKSQLIEAHSDPQLCGVIRLRTLYQWYKHHSPDRLQGPIFCSVRHPYQGLTSQAVGSRVRECVTKYSTDAGETMHGLRRGAMQQAVADREAPGDIMQHAGLTSVATFQKYVDLGRHLA